MEQPIGQLHDIVFGEAGDFLAAISARIFKRVTIDFFASRPRNKLEALIDIIGLPMLNAGV
jgi:hypothetical protein